MNRQYPEPVTGAFILNHENKLFLMKSYKWSDMWVVPGGHIELDEKIEDALRRETFEETGLTIKNPEFICLWEFINEGEFIKKKHMIFFNYKVVATSEKVTLNSEGQEYGWFSKDEALKLPLNKYTRMTIEKYPTKVFK